MALGHHCRWSWLSREVALVALRTSNRLSRMVASRIDLAAITDSSVFTGGGKVNNQPHVLLQGLGKIRVHR